MPSFSYSSSAPGVATCAGAPTCPMAPCLSRTWPIRIVAPSCRRKGFGVRVDDRFLHRRLVRRIECATDGASIGQTLQAGRPLRHRLIPGVAQVRRRPTPDQRVRDQECHDRAAVEHGAGFQMLETPSLASVERKAIEHRLEHDSCAVAGCRSWSRICGAARAFQCTVELLIFILSRRSPLWNRSCVC